MSIKRYLTGKLPGTSLKLCGGMVCKPILFSRLGQAEQKYKTFQEMLSSAWLLEELIMNMILETFSSIIIV